MSFKGENHFSFHGIVKNVKKEHKLKTPSYRKNLKKTIRREPSLIKRNLIGNIKERDLTQEYVKKGVDPASILDAKYRVF